MENLKIDASIGNTFDSVATKAKELSAEQDRLVEFEFNGVTCVVDYKTDLSLLYRDYANAHTMEWKTVGPVCNYEYLQETIDELKRRTDENDKRYAAERLQYKQEQESKKRIAEEKVIGIEMEFSDKDTWNAGLENNKDGYGSAIYSFAESWAKLMQYEINRLGLTNVNVSVLATFADHTSHEADTDGLTGFMYGAAVSVLSKTWKHGEALRKWHNKEYNPEGDGVVNPAILTLNTPTK